MMKEETGLMCTYTGKLFGIFEPDPDSICIEDIAHALACTNRYRGHTRAPYSVAEHCVRMSYPELPGDPLVNLLHDAVEAYVGDIISPHKRKLCWYIEDEYIPFKRLERMILPKIWEGLSLGYREHPRTKEADNIMYMTEVRDLLPPETWPHFLRDPRITQQVKPLVEPIFPWSWDSAEIRYLQRYKELTK